jgi:hypothetical protein
MHFQLYTLFIDHTYIYTLRMVAEDERNMWV